MIDVAEKLAESQAIQKLNRAMMSSGGDTAVKMEYAHNFAPESITVLPCTEAAGGVPIQRLDLNNLIAAEAAGASQFR